jgi:hypothetical protein
MLEDHIETIGVWLGLYKDRAEKLEAALATERARNQNDR